MGQVPEAVLLQLMCSLPLWLEARHAWRLSLSNLPRFTFRASRMKEVNIQDYQDFIS